ncbi:uncharacterized protein LOC122405181 [Colletes gigas]|uniref:uncharacterized protein LOC122405181 n=1 Tax=Colletes gigas TaxID=935657 RepID=UPI001C9B9921|nr:uncharacterized protein LOC122405181 [Colletes gigas]
MAQAGLSTKSKESVLSTNGQYHSRKRTRSSLEPVLEIKQISNEIDREKVGNLKKIAVGMTFGPYIKEEENEGVEEEEEASKNQKYPVVSEQILKIDSQNISMVRQFFERFLKENKNYSRIKEKLDKSGKSLVIVRQKFACMIDNYFQAKRNLENVRDKLVRQQQLRLAMENGDSVGSDVPEVEQIIGRDIACQEKVLMNSNKELTQTQNEISNLLKDQLEMRSKLKSGFHEYCVTLEFLPLYNDKSMQMLLEPVEKESLEKIRRKFNQFQRAMMRKFEEKSRTKKVQFDGEWACKGANYNH